MNSVEQKRIIAIIAVLLIVLFVISVARKAVVPEENLTEYSLEKIKVSLPEEYELLEELEHKYSTGLKFGKKGCDDFLFSIIHLENISTEPLDIPGELFFDEEGEGFKEITREEIKEKIESYERISEKNFDESEYGDDIFSR